MVRPYTHVGACGSLLQEGPEMGGTVGDERSGGLQASRMINHAWDRTGDEGDSKCRWEPLRRATAQNLEGTGPRTKYGSTPVGCCVRQMVPEWLMASHARITAYYTHDPFI